MLRYYDCFGCVDCVEVFLTALVLLVVLCFVDCVHYAVLMVSCFCSSLC